MKKVNTNNKAGFALMSTMGYMVLCFSFAGIVINAANEHVRKATQAVSREAASYLAEAGIEELVQTISDGGGYVDDNVTVYYKGSRGSYSADLTKIGWGKYEIKSLGAHDGLARRIGVKEVRLTSFGDYFMWIGNNAGLNFHVYDEIYGKVHSDAAINFRSSSILGGATFWDEVTSIAGKHNGSIDYVTFHKGYDWNTPQGSLADINFDNLKNLAATAGVSSGVNGLTLEGKTNMRIVGDDVYITNERKGWVDERVTINPDQLIYVSDATSGNASTRGGNVYLDSGSLDGQLTIVSDEDIFIEGDLLYDENPIDYPESDDVLGLISKDDVRVSTKVKSGLDIYAAIVAAGQKDTNNPGEFNAVDVGSSTMGIRGNINLYGSLTQDSQGILNYKDSNGVRVRGFGKNFFYDPRLKENPPAYYPAIGSGSLTFKGWSEWTDAGG